MSLNANMFRYLFAMVLFYAHLACIAYPESLSERLDRTFKDRNASPIPADWFQTKDDVECLRPYLANENEIISRSAGHPIEKIAETSTNTVVRKACVDLIVSLLNTDQYKYNCYIFNFETEDFSSNSKEKLLDFCQTQYDINRKTYDDPTRSLHLAKLLAYADVKQGKNFVISLINDIEKYKQREKQSYLDPSHGNRDFWDAVVYAARLGDKKAVRTLREIYNRVNDNNDKLNLLESLGFTRNEEFFPDIVESLFSDYQYFCGYDCVTTPASEYGAMALSNYFSDLPYPHKNDIDWEAIRTHPGFRKMMGKYGIAFMGPREKAQALRDDALKNNNPFLSGLSLQFISDSPGVTGPPPSDALKIGSQNGILRLDLGDEAGALDFIWVPSGKYDDNLDWIRERYDLPVNSSPETVEVKGFWILKIPVLPVQWLAVMQKGISDYDKTAYGYIMAYSEKVNPVGVTWYDVGAYCEVLSRKLHGCHFRTPTEREWEYASRVGGDCEGKDTILSDEINGNVYLPHLMSRAEQETPKNILVGEGGPIRNVFEWTATHAVEALPKSIWSEMKEKQSYINDNMQACKGDYNSGSRGWSFCESIRFYPFESKRAFRLILEPSESEE